MYEKLQGLRVSDRQLFIIFITCFLIDLIIALSVCFLVANGAFLSGQFGLFVNREQLFERCQIPSLLVN